jgi:hypothetical protein
MGNDEQYQRSRIVHVLMASEGTNSQSGEFHKLKSESCDILVSEENATHENHLTFQGMP